MLSTIIIVKNEKEVIQDCLESVKWTDEIVVLDGGSTDGTLEIIKKYPVKLVRQKATGMSYGSWRNQGRDETGGDWILYVDADERIPPLLKEEILQVTRNTRHEKRDKKYTAFAIPRRNFLLGKELKHGGWYPDYVKRLFLKKNLEKWVGRLHEEPIFKGEMGKLENPMIHWQPETIEPALQKSIIWSDIEARLLFEANHPKIAWWRVLRMGITTLFDRLVEKQGFRDGTEGWIESFYQAFHTMIVYLRLWEMQEHRKTQK
ncbi:MAG: glycosyltransferase family 2 protein [Patescibacteria group bacterium]